MLIVDLIFNSLWHRVQCSLKNHCYNFD